MNLQEYFYSSYATLFSRPSFQALNRALLKCAVRGLGLLNAENLTSSGERYVLTRLAHFGKLSQVIDIGANRGEFTNAVLFFNPSAHVIAFEPHPGTVGELRSRITNPDNIELVEAAVGNTDRFVNLFDYANGTSTGSPHASVHERVISDLHLSEGESIPSSREVRQVTLDNWLIGNHPNLARPAAVDLLKIDTEGNELSVLRGAQGLIEKRVFNYISF